MTTTPPCYSTALLSYSTVEDDNFDVAVGGEPDQFSEDPSEEVKVSKDWNAKFQGLLSQPDSVSKWEKIGRLSRDFVEVSETYGKIIISEVHVADTKKTVKPLHGRGIAGGAKYLVQDIFFKFSMDTDLGNGRWLYGKKSRNDEKAMKSAKSELKGASSLFRCDLQGIRLPLIAVIYYRGYCLVAESQLPVNSKSIVYGSEDGGKSICCSDTVVNGVMKSVGESLNLSKHLVGNQEIYGPGDIEVHRGLDDQLYLLDFGRLFPPEPPTHENEKQTNFVFHAFLRPTLVKKNSVPLCSDGLTAWCNGDPDAEKYSKDLQQVKDKILQQMVPQFSHYLEQNYADIAKSEFKQIMFDLHRKGLNIRHLGYIRSHLNHIESKLSKYILTECIARALKHELKELIRNKTYEKKKSTIEPFLDEIYTFLSPILQASDTLPRKFKESVNWSSRHSRSTRKKNLEINGNTISVSKSSGGNNFVLIGDHPIPHGASHFFFEIHVEVLGHIKIGLSEGNHKNHSNLYRYDLFKGTIEDKDATIKVNQCKEGSFVGVFYSAWDKTITFTKNGSVIGYKIKKVDITHPLYPLLWFSSETNSTITFNFGPVVHFPIQSLHKVESERRSSFIQMNTPSSLLFWKGSIKSMVEMRYPSILKDEEREKEFDLRMRTDLSFLISRLHKISGVLFSDRVLGYTNGNSLVIERNDLLGFKPRVFHMGIIEYAEALSTLLNYQKMSHVDKENPKILQELKKAGTKLSRTFESAPIRSVQELYYCASIWYELGIVSEKSERKNLMEKAAEMIIKSEEVNNTAQLSIEILVLQGKLYCELGDISTSPTDKNLYFSKAKEKFHLVASQNESLVNSLLNDILHYMMDSNRVVNANRLREQAQIIWECFVGNNQNTPANIQLFYIICLGSAYTEDIPDENELLALSMNLMVHSVKTNKQLVESELSKALMFPIHGNPLFFVLQVGLINDDLQSVLLNVIEKQKIKLTEYTHTLDRLIINLERSSLPPKIQQFLHQIKKKYSYTIQSSKSSAKPIRECNLSVIKENTIDASALVLARALLDSPYKTYHLGTKKKEEKSEWYNKKCIQYSFKYGRSYCASTLDDIIVGVIIWQHPHESNASFSRMIEVGFMDMPIVFGIEGTYRYGLTFKHLQQKRREIMKNEEHMFLYVIGVDPLYQRQGYGSALMQPFLKEADDSNLKCFLECSGLESVSFFKKWGFEVVEEIVQHHTGSPVYEMVRKPKNEQ
eukprot:TRINITY_DN6768_c0_g1_i2.p1 TRINITY_DN6768_c0_g1~~TRINITY_DN6768_c0_g1_i2.p1  ORF type:complete len:1238 (+),score=331.84 TRINITY_DN6768_c0_g1_i2:64-3777(+)